MCSRAVGARTGRGAGTDGGCAGASQATGLDAYGKRPSRPSAKRTRSRTASRRTRRQAPTWTRGAAACPSTSTRRPGSRAGHYAPRRWTPTATTYAATSTPPFGAIPLDAIRREQIQAWIKHLCDQSLAPRTVRTGYGILASILRAAVLDERIPRSRCVRITLPEIQPAHITVLSPTQVRALAAAMHPRYAITVLAGYGLGLRQGEALALSRSRIDFQHHTYRVDRQVITCVRAGSQPRFAPPKTKASRRTVPMPAFIETTLQQHIKQFVADGDDRLITTTRGHLPRRSHYDQNILKPALTAGLPILELSRHLGHATTAETTDTYGHLLADADDRTRHTLDHLWNRNDPGGDFAARGDTTRGEDTGQGCEEPANRTGVPQHYGTYGHENTALDTDGHQDIRGTTS